MASDYYDDEDEGGKPAKSDGTPTTMLSRSVFGGKSVSPGDRITLVVRKVHDDEVAVEYSSGKADKDEPEKDAPETDEATVEAPQEQDLYA